MNAASIQRVTGLLAEHATYVRPDPAPISDVAKGDAIENDVSQSCVPPQIERAEETPEWSADVERWRWIVVGLGWGW